MKSQLNLFGQNRIEMGDSIGLTIQSLNAYASEYDHWVITWSGGKDSTTLVTLIVSLIDAGLIKGPRKLTVLYADTRMELPPLWFAAQEIKGQLKKHGVNVRTVVAPLAERFLPYILGRGVPPPNNNTMRWCTQQIKLEPMQMAIDQLYKKDGKKMLILTGVRQGESAIRDGRIAMSCGKDGAECGQGWFQKDLSETVGAKLAPLLHWRVCLVWDWLKIYAKSTRKDLFDHYPGLSGGGWNTDLLADAYGGDEAEEINARTGCVACPLASKDNALTVMLKMPQWSYLQPLTKLRPIYREMRLPINRLRMPGGEKRKDGTLSKNQNRMGPLTIEARQHFFERILAIQNEINKEAKRLNRPLINILSRQEQAFIKKCWKENLFPNKWSGDEPRADEVFVPTFQDGSKQPFLFEF